MNVQATAKYIHMSPRQTRLVVDLIRGLSIVEAQKQLQFSRKAAAEPVLKVLNSAIANAQNNFNLDTTGYTVVVASVSEGPTIHRFMPRAQGRAAAIRKRLSHITVAVGPKAKKGDVEKVVETKVEEKKPVAKKTTPKAKKETANKVETKS